MKKSIVTTFFNNPVVGPIAVNFIETTMILV